MKIILLAAFTFLGFDSGFAQTDSTSANTFCFSNRSRTYQNGHGAFEFSFTNTKQPQAPELQIFYGQGALSAPWRYRYVLKIPNADRDIYSYFYTYVSQEISEAEFRLLEQLNPSLAAPVGIRILRDGPRGRLLSIEENHRRCR